VPTGWRRSLLAGLVDALPFIPGVLVLGAIWGTSAGPAGIGPLTAVVMSTVVWSGAGQFAALPLWREGVGIVAVSVLLLSMRFSLMATSMAPLLAEARVSRPMRVLIAYTITDETYALIMTRRRGRLDAAYLIGAWLPLYIPWIAGTAIGVLMGAQVPPEWRHSLEAIFPIVFLTLTVLVCTAPALAAVAVLGGLLSVLFALWLPVGWNVLAAGVLASLVGPALETRWHRQ
jgi:predicted branched-subunit amino acid permease